MTTSTLTLTEFLLARIAEDEDTDMGLPHRAWCNGWPGDSGPCSCGVRSRVLAECEAKQRIVESYRESEGDDDGTMEPTSTVVAYVQGEAAGLGEAIVLLAASYSDHPDYRDEWRP